MNKRLHFSIGLILVLIVSTVAFCSDPVDAPSAPIPSQILSAKKIFIANGGSEVKQALDTIPTNYTYDRFYADVKAWGRFDLVSSPAEADLVFEIRFITVLPVGGGSNGFRTVRQLQLLIIDPKTHVTLWTINEQFNAALWDSNKRKDLDKGMSSLVVELKELTTPAASSPKPANSPAD